jgi:hypothetical protein
VDDARRDGLEPDPPWQELSDVFAALVGCDHPPSTSLRPRAEHIVVIGAGAAGLIADRLAGARSESRFCVSTSFLFPVVNPPLENEGEFPASKENCPKKPAPAQNVAEEAA